MPGLLRLHTADRPSLAVVHAKGLNSWRLGVGGPPNHGGIYKVATQHVTNLHVTDGSMRASFDSGVGSAGTCQMQGVGWPHSPCRWRSASYGPPAVDTAALLAGLALSFALG